MDSRQAFLRIVRLRAALRAAFFIAATLPLHPSTPPGITGYKTLPAWALCLGRNTSPMVKTSIPQLEIQIVPVRNLLPYQRALRKNAKAVDRMVASIREYGFKIPLLVSEQNVVIDGELRLKAAQKLKYTELPVIVCRDWSTEQVSAFRLMANRSATWAEWDLEAVAQEIAELSKTDFDLTLTGFDACEIEDLLSPVFDDETLESVPGTPNTITSTRGDLWICGKHRVLCADSTSVTR